MRELSSSLWDTPAAIISRGRRSGSVRIWLTSSVLQDWPSICADAQTNAMFPRGISTLGKLCPLLLAAAIAACGGSATTSVTGPTSAKCAVSIANSPAEIPASGGSGSLALETARECPWSATTDDPWITLAATSGQGAATLAYTVPANPNGARRRGRVIVSDKTVEVAQAPAPCRYTVSVSAVDAAAAGDALSVSLTATPEC